MNITIILVLIGLVTFLMCAYLEPAAFKLGELGLSGWAARLPFYLLRLYIGPAVLLTRRSANWYVTGPLLGAALDALEYGAGMPGSEKWLNLASGILQGLRWRTRHTASAIV